MQDFSPHKSLILSPILSPQNLFSEDSLTARKQLLYVREEPRFKQATFMHIRNKKSQDFSYKTSLSILNKTFNITPFPNIKGITTSGKRK